MPTPEVRTSVCSACAHQLERALLRVIQAGANAAGEAVRILAEINEVRSPRATERAERLPAAEYDEASAR